MSSKSNKLIHTLIKALQGHYLLADRETMDNCVKAQEALEAYISKLERNLTWIINEGPGAHINNIIAVAKEPFND